jgi:hypothetical protein
MTVYEFITGDPIKNDKLYLVTGEAATKNPGDVWVREFYESEVDHVNLAVPRKIKVQDPHSKTPLGTRIVDPFHIFVIAGK